MKRHSWLLGGGALAATLASCSIYGPDLVGGGGAGGNGGSTSSGSTMTTSTSSSTSTSSTTSSTSSTTSSTTSSSTSSASSSGPMPCTEATDCPGTDTECKKRSCSSGMCGFDNKQSGTVLVAQTAGDCKVAICDGNGNETSIPDNNDVGDDDNECTTDGCSAGMPTHMPVATGTSCNTGGGKKCSAAGKCVECVTGADCGSLVCAGNVCIAATCMDGVQNAGETDVDCGGTTACPRCDFNEKCGGDSDCKSGSCIGAKCAASCTDGTKNGTETDVDCGGTCPTKCASGKTCGVDGDCQSGECSGGKCVDVLLISELQTRGTNGGVDEFIEIYNPNAYPVTFDTSWEIWTRNAATSACAMLSKRITGAGQVIPARGHLLYTNGSAMGYDGSVTGDGTYTTGFTDSGQVVLLHSGALVDSLCYYFNATTQGNLTCPAAMQPTPWFPCQGAVSNSPHNDGNTGSSATDVSLDRKPGGAAGNGQNTGDNSADWAGNVTANPQNLMSPATP